MNDDVEPVDEDLADAYGFEPAVSATGSDQHRPSRATRRAVTKPRSGRLGKSAGKSPAGPSPVGKASGATRPRKPSGLRRRLSASVILLGALAVMGGSYAAFATSSGASDTGNSASEIANGRQLYQTSCITCHGANLEGVDGNGPSLIGVGGAAAYFQISTGRMPLAQNGAYAPQHGTAKFDEQQTEQIAAYIESVGGGPSIPTGNLRASDNELGNGGELYRLNCASCHGTTFKGAPLSGGKVAPSLNEATDKEIYTAMLSGPESMPVFGDNQLTASQKKQVINYIQTLKASADPGGSGIDRIGPVSEAIVIWVGGIGAVMIAILWIGARAR